MDTASTELTGSRNQLPATNSETGLRALAVVGLGYWGPNWVRNLCQARSAERLICCDLSLERRRRIQQLYPNVEVTSDLNDVLSDREIEGVDAGRDRNPNAVVRGDFDRAAQSRALRPDDECQTPGPGTRDKR